MLKLIRGLLKQTIDNIDAGNSNITDEEAKQLVDLIKNINDPYISKYQAYQYLGISRATFDNLVKEGKLPKGIKRSGFKELAWKKTDILQFITKHK